MRIVHTCLRYPPALGGVETYVQQLVERTRDIAVGRDVRVLTSHLRTHGPISELNPEQLLDDPPYVQRLFHSVTPGISYPRLQALDYYLGHHQPDVIHGYSFWYQPADVAARYAQRRRIPFIFHPIYYDNAVRRKALWRLYRATRGRQTFAAADAVVVISPHEQQLIEAAQLPVRRSVLIPPGVDVAEFESQHQNPFAARGVRGSVLLAVSRLASGKGVDELIAALPDILKQQPDTQLVIIGDDFGMRAQLELQSEQLGVAKHVHFWGAVSREELITAYQHADVFVHASDYEAFGIVLAEALAAGTPVVARNVAAVPYVAPHEQVGLLFTTHDELVRHCTRLLADAALRHELAAAGRERVAVEFTWDLSVNRLLKLYEELGAK